MKCGIVGPPLSGKSTLFNILTSVATVDQFSGKREPRRGIAKLADPRLDAIAGARESRKVVPATVEYIDVPGVSMDKQVRESYPASYLTELQGVDTLALVLREFQDDSIPHPAGSIDPQRDLSDAALEFIINDLAITERRLEKLAKAHDEDSKREAVLLEHCRDMLSDEKALREHEFKPEEEKVLRGYSLLSLKPLLIVVNLGEASAPDAKTILDGLKQKIRLAEKGIGWAVVAAGIEAEISTLEEADRGAFLTDLGFSLPALDRIKQATFNLLGLITFFTTNENESRAWSITSDSTAVQAAGTIHNDLARGFIRAEVCRWDELVETDGSFSRLKESGKLRLEGKDYIVADGDVLQVRFNV